jgi:hypothetical protein
MIRNTVLDPNRAGKDATDLKIGLRRRSWRLPHRLCWQSQVVVHIKSRSWSALLPVTLRATRSHLPRWLPVARRSR